MKTFEPKLQFLHRTNRIEYQTKGGRLCSVPIIPSLRPILDRLRAIADGPHVLPKTNGRTSLHLSCKRAGLRRLTFHDFRHLFTTRAIKSGVDVPTVARWLGHKDGGALLAKRYFHLLDSHSARMAQRVQI